MCWWQSRGRWVALRKQWLVLTALLVLALVLILPLRDMESHFVVRPSVPVGQTHLPRRGADLVRQAVNSSAQQLILTVVPTHRKRQFALGAVGLSIETNQLATHNLNASSKSLVKLMRQLGPGILRIGGDSLDYSWWTGGHEGRPAWATSVVTPSDLIDLRRLLKITGWRAILGVDLGHFEPGRAADEARVAERLLSSRLLGFEIGNEPDAYSTDQVHLRPRSYNASNYLEELASYSAAMGASVPGVSLYGPEVSSQAWLTTIASDKAVSLAAITRHYYPTSYSVPNGVCEATSVPTALDLLSPEVREQEDAVLQGLVGAGHIAHRDVRISETNTTSSCDMGGGPDTSPVFASALWSLDWILRSASAGVAGLNFHGNFGICVPDTFSPICAPSRAAVIRGRVAARPEYYGLLAARELEGGYFVPADISEEHPPDDLTAYATVHRRGIITLAIDNFDTEGPAALVLKAPGYDRASDELLVAPSIDATADVTFGQRSFNMVGMRKSKVMKVSKGYFRLTLPPASAAIITLQG